MENMTNEKLEQIVSDWKEIEDFVNIKVNSVMAKLELELRSIGKVMGYKRNKKGVWKKMQMEGTVEK